MGFDCFVQCIFGYGKPRLSALHYSSIVLISCLDFWSTTCGMKVSIRRSTSIWLNFTFSRKFKIGILIRHQTVWHANNGKQRNFKICTSMNLCGLINCGDFSFNLFEIHLLAWNIDSVVYMCVEPSSHGRFRHKIRIEWRSDVLMEIMFSVWQQINVDRRCRRSVDEANFSLHTERTNSKNHLCRWAFDHQLIIANVDFLSFIYRIFFDWIVCANWVWVTMKSSGYHPISNVWRIWLN